MGKQDDGGSAFPVSSYVNASGETYSSSIKGMTLRDYFAAKAMATFVSVVFSGNEMAGVVNDECDAAGIGPQQWVAQHAYDAADAMLEARK